MKLFNKLNSGRLFLLLTVLLITLGSCNLESSTDETNVKKDEPSAAEGGDTVAPAYELPLVGEWKGTISNTVFNFTFSDTSFSGCGTSGDIVKIVKTSNDSGYFVFKYTGAYVRALIGYYGVGKWRRLATDSVEFCEEVKDLNNNSQIFEPALFRTAQQAENELKDSSYASFVVLAKQ